MIRIVIVAADGLGRDCLESLLTDCHGVEVVAVAANLGLLSRAAAGATPDTVLVVGDRAGGAVIPSPEHLRSIWPAAEPVLGFYEPSEAGAGRSVAGYRRVVDLSTGGEAIAALLIGSAAPPPPPGANPGGKPSAPSPTSAALSRREAEVLRHLATGLSSRESADLLGLRSRTIDAHRRNVSRKLSLPSVAELTRYAIAIGMIDPEAGHTVAGASE